MFCHSKIIYFSTKEIILRCCFIGIIRNIIDLEYKSCRFKECKTIHYWVRHTDIKKKKITYATGHMLFWGPQIRGLSVRERLTKPIMLLPEFSLIFREYWLLYNISNMYFNISRRMLTTFSDSMTFSSKIATRLQQ